MMFTKILNGVLYGFVYCVGLLVSAAKWLFDWKHFIIFSGYLLIVGAVVLFWLAALAKDDFWREQRREEEERWSPMTILAVSLATMLLFLTAGGIRRGRQVREARDLIKSVRSPSGAKAFIYTICAVLALLLGFSLAGCFKNF